MGRNQQKMPKMKVLPDGRRVKMEWYEEWEEDENTRRTSINSSLNRIDRLRDAARAFKSGRPQFASVSLLWDSWRQYVGLIYQQPRKGVLHESEESRINGFLNKPEEAIKIYFSGHWREKGHQFDEKRCKEGPILIGFFLRYLVRSRVFPDEEAALKRAIELCDLAQRELLATLTLGCALPDEVSKGLEDLHTFTTDADEDHKDSNDADQPDLKKRKLEPSGWGLPYNGGAPGGGGTWKTSDGWKTNSEWGAGSGSKTNDGGWGNKSSGWGLPYNGGAPGGGGTWGAGSGWEADSSCKTNNGGWGNLSTGGNSTWGDTSGPTAKNGLFDHLGPTALPYTHTTGIVERSTRKIARVVRPPSVDAKSANNVQNLSQVEAIEQDLETRMGEVIFLPWIKIRNHVASDLLPPEILSDSRGAVIIPESTKSDFMSYGIKSSGRASLTVGPPTVDVTSGSHSPFDPNKDEICLLVDPKHLDMFEQCVGMGVCATWVQIVRKETPGEGVNEAIDFQSKRKKLQPLGAPGKNGEPTRWWYMKGVSFAATSFHTDKYIADQED